jgi:2,3-bisphosphoglycerate-dependent phosphoglycerate mutase
MTLVARASSMDTRHVRRLSSLSRRALSLGASDPTAATPPQKKKNPVRILESARSAAKVRPPVRPGSSTANKVHHPAHHFMDGGLPCDPAPPRYALAEYGEESLYTLILLRHGESEWNSLNRYTGWCDVELTDTGRAEARTAGRLLYENNMEIDQAFTSVLKRASFSCNMALNAAQQHWVPVTKTWRLNERHYGALQGYHKDTAWQELGLDQELVMQMRRAYATRPPRMPDDHPYWHGHDRRYRKLTPEQLEASRAESLKDAAQRIMPFFNSVITPSIQSGKKCLIVSHANTIRTLVKHIDGISDEDIKGMTIPTGIPLLYRLDKNMRPVDPQIELEFRYMVEPKGYVRDVVIAVVAALGFSLTRCYSFFGAVIPGAPLGPMDFMASISATWNVCRVFKRSATRPIATGKRLFYATLGNPSAGWTWRTPPRNTRSRLFRPMAQPE